MSKQTEALRLAHWLQWPFNNQAAQRDAAAAELRRLNDVELHSKQLERGFDKQAKKIEQLEAANAELLKAQTMGQSLNTPDFLDWVADRLVHKYGENPNVDFVLSLRERAAAGRAAVTKAEAK